MNEYHDNNLKISYVDDDPKSLIFLGRRSLSKLYLLLHLSKMLKSQYSIAFETVNPSLEIAVTYDYNGIEISEYPDSDLLRASIAAKNDKQYHRTGMKKKEDLHMIKCSRIYVFDVPDYMVKADNESIFLVVEPDKNSLESAVQSMIQTGKHSSRFYVQRILLDIYEQSRINTRYLDEAICRKLPDNAEPSNVFHLYAEERNSVVILDNQHDDQLRLSRLSPYYKRLLMDIAENALQISKKQSAAMLKMADRRHS